VIKKCHFWQKNSFLTAVFAFRFLFLYMGYFYANTIKFFKAINLLASPRGTTIKGLMENLGISRRSVFRLLITLEELGFPLIDEQFLHRSEKTYRLMESYTVKLPNMIIPNLCLTREELELVLIILESHAQNHQSASIPRLNAIREKIMAMQSKENSYEQFNQKQKRKLISKN